MSSTATERLYSLLPAIYRVRDVENGEPLRALLEVMEQEFLAVESDIANLYDNWFIETCDEWAVPYIGELLGARQLHSVSNGAFTLRGYVGNTFAYRQAKGTAAILEQLARDVTGWPAHVVEFFQHLGWTQYLEHHRPNVQIQDLRKANDLELIDTPFNRSMHTVDIRRIPSNRGRYNITNIGIFLWRLRSYRMLQSRAIPALFDGIDLELTSYPGDGRYYISPILRDMPLFNNPISETDITHISEEINAPGPLRRRPLYDELEARRLALAQVKDPVVTYFGAQPPFRVVKRFGSTMVPVDPKDLYVCDLSGWRIPDPGKVAVDPVLGRVTYGEDLSYPLPDQLYVDYSYGFSADIGGGPYNRADSITTGDSSYWRKTVSKTELADYSTVVDAINAWMSAPLVNGNRQSGVITILDSDLYGSDGSGIPQDVFIPQNTSLVIQAHDGVRPVIYQDFTLASPDSNPVGQLTLSGLLIVGGVTTQGAKGELIVKHCTIVPGAAGNGTSIDCANSEMRLTIESSIVGHLSLTEPMEFAVINDSIVDGVGFAQTGSGVGYAIGTASSAGPPMSIQRSTIYGKVHAREMTLASEVLFTSQITIKRRQVGCIRFCYVTPGSRTPRRYRCQPDSALKENPAPMATIVAARVRPEFTSTHYGDPGYAQLSQNTAVEIWTGAEDGAEIGVYNQLKQAHREANLRAGLDEAMRLGLEAGIIYVT